MRIELNAGGLGGGATINGFQTDFSKMIKKSDRTVSSLKMVKAFTNVMNGGVGNLRGAVDSVERRLAAEEQRAENLRTVQREVNDFVDDVHKADRKAKTIVRKNEKEFYRVNKWARPPAPKSQKKQGLISKAWNWLCDKGKKVVDGVKKFIDGTIDFAKGVVTTLGKIKDSIVQFCKDHKRALIEIAIGAAVIVVAAVAVVVTGGAALAVAACVGACVAAGVGAAVAGGTAAYKSYKENGKVDWGEVFDESAKGFMSGSISGAIGGLLGPEAGPAANIIASGASGLISETTHSLLDDGRIDAGEGREIVKSTVSGLITGGISEAGKSLFKGASSQATGKVVDGITTGGKKKFLEAMKEGFKDKLKDIPGDTASEILNTGLGHLEDATDRGVRNVVGAVKDILKNKSVTSGIPKIPAIPPVVPKIPTIPITPVVPKIPTTPVVPKLPEIIGGRISPKKTPVVPKIDINININININPRSIRTVTSGGFTSGGISSIARNVMLKNSAQTALGAIG